MGARLKLWCVWLELVIKLRPAFSRLRTFQWFLVALAGFSVRTDLRGVSSFIRAFGLKASCYQSLLDFFASASMCPDKLAFIWTRVVLSCFSGILKVNGRILLVADGIKIPKSGRKMPAVKRLHQQSGSNTKPEYITGHSCQSLGVLAGSLLSVFCTPLITRIHEGIKFTNRDKRTQLDKLVEMVRSLKIKPPFILIADAYYASGKIITPFLAEGNHLLTRMKSNAVAYADPIAGKIKNRGRPKIYACAALIL
jgi:hypothetical protein